MYIIILLIQVVLAQVYKINVYIIWPTSNKNNNINVKYFLIIDLVLCCNNLRLLDQIQNNNVNVNFYNCLIV